MRASTLSDAAVLRNSPWATTRPLRINVRAFEILSAIGGGVPESGTIESTMNVAG